MSSTWRRLAILCLACAAVFAIAGCGGSNDDNNSASSTESSSGTPEVGVDDLTADFSAMTKLKDLASEGKGMIGVLLPDTTTSTRYVQYDAPNLKKAFETAGLSSDQFKIDNAHGSTSTMQQQAEADITAGASVLLIDPIDPGSGAAIESKAESQGVKVIDYDRLVTGGPKDRYYVSFNNVEVGKLIGEGEVECIDAWKVSKPKVLVMSGAATDNNAKLFAQGYNGVLNPHFADGSYTKVGAPAGTWDAPTAATTFEQQLTAHPNMNAVLMPNDTTANAVISVLLKNKIPANTFPVTGQDAATDGLQNILKGYQCGTVYKPYFAEAQAAAALALYLRAGKTPPSSLVNDTTKDTTLNADIKSVYTKPFWVTKENMDDTVIKDGTITAADSLYRQGGRRRARRQESSSPGLDRASPVQGGARPARFVDLSKGRDDDHRERRRAPPSPQGRLEELRAGAGALEHRFRDPGRPGDRAHRRQRRRQVGDDQDASRGSTHPTTGRSSGKGSRFGSARPARPPRSASRPSIRISRSVTTWTSCKTCSSGGSA